MPYRIEDLAYIAGVLDSDGYIGLARQRENRRKNRTESYSPRVVVTQCQIGAVELIHSVFGGRKYELEKGENHKTLHAVCINDRKHITEILTVVAPYLRIKKRQAELVLGFCKMRDAKLVSKPRLSNGQFASSKNTYGVEEKSLWEGILSLNQTGKEVPHSLQN